METSGNLSGFYDDPPVVCPRTRTRQAARAVEIRPATGTDMAAGLVTRTTPTTQEASTAAVSDTLS